MGKKIWEWIVHEWVRLLFGAAVTGALAAWPDFRGVLNTRVTASLWVPLLLASGWIIVAYMVWRSRSTKSIPGQPPASVTEAPAPKFKPFEVMDTGANLYWRIKRPPASWLESDAEQFSSGWFEEILEGPFCGHDGCRGPLSGFSVHEWRVPEKCPICRKKQNAGSVKLYEIRKRSVQALQRWVRRGNWELEPDALFDVTK